MSHHLEEQLQQWVQLLGTLMSVNNVERKSAEEFYEQQMQQNTAISLPALVECFGRVDVPMTIRSFAGVLLRRAIERYSGSLPPVAMQNLRSRMLEIWSTESHALLLHRLSHALAQSSLKSEWNDLIPHMVQYAQSQQGASIIPVLGLIEIIADYCPEDIASNLALLGQFLGQFINSSVGSSEKVRLACAKTTAACIAALEEESQREAFKPAVEPLLAVLGNALSAGEEIEATKLIGHLVTVAQVQPMFFKSSIDSVAAAMLSVSNATHLEFSTRASALEWLLTISENAPAMARRCAALVQGLVPCAATIMLDVEIEEAEWIRAKYSEEDFTEDEPCLLGDEAIERMANGLGGKTVSTAVLATAQQNMNNNSWKYRRAAVASISRLAEGSTKYFKSKYLEDSLNFLSMALQDPSPRVQYEGVHAIGRFAVLYTESISELLPRFLPPLTMLVHDANSCDRIRGYAASSLISLTNPDHCDFDVLQPMLDPLLQSLISCLQSAPLEVRSPCLSLLGCIAQVAGDDFAPYYGSFMPGIKAVLREATAPELVTLRGKAMECAGLVGQAVGAQVFAQDAMEIMHLFSVALARDADHDSIFEYILPACARISRALHTQFQPFLSMVMEPLLAGAKIEIQFTMTDADEDAVEGEVTHDEDNGTESAVVSFGAGVKKVISVNTHAVQQKTQAARCLYEFADALKGELRNYILPTLSALLLLVTEKHSADVRSSATLGLAKSFDAFINALQLGYLQDNFGQFGSLDAVLSECLTKLMECIRSETDETARACAAEALRDVLQACFQSGNERADGSRGGFLLCPGIPACQKIVSEILLHCQESLSRRTCKVQAIAQNDGYDDDDREGAAEELEEEEELLITLADAMGQVLKLHGEGFMEVFDAIVAPAFSPFLQAHQPEALQLVAVYVVDDAIEFGGPAAQKYITNVLPALLRNSQSANSLLRQASVYGIAKALLVAPAIMVHQLSTVLPVILQVLHDPSSQEEDNEGTFENAVFAVGTVCTEMQYRSAVSSMGNTADLTKVWLQFLPLKTDELSAKIASKQLCDAVERNDTAILGEQYSHLADVFRVIAEIFENNSATTDGKKGSPSPNSVALLAEDGEAIGPVAHPDTVRRMQNIMRSFASLPKATDAAPGSLNSDTIHSIFTSLSQEHQQVLKSVL